MLNRIILLSGPISSGKSTLAKGLAQRYGMSIFKTNEVLKKLVKKDIAQDRKALQIEGERLDKKTQGSWVLQALMERSSEFLLTSDCIVDSV